MDRVRIGPVKGLRIAVTAFVLSITLFAAMVAVTFYLRSAAISDTERFAVELRQGLVETCERNGNPLRRTVQMILREQIERRAKIPASFFPNIPPATLRRLVREQNQADRVEIQQLEPLRCRALYPGP